MDWFSWLSRTNLDPCLIYQYGVTLSRNELQHEDISYFNHEFLSSMGISIAKHRLEILKLAKKETPNNTIRISKLVKSIKKCVKRFVFINSSSSSSSSVKALPLPEPLPEPELDPPRFTQPWKDHHHQVKLPVIRTRRQAKSGPLDIGRSSMPNNWMVNNNNIRRSRLKLSGPLDGRVPESLLVDDRKLKLSGPLDGNTHDRLVFSYRSPKLYASSDINQRLMMNNKSPPPMRTTPKPLDCYNNNNNNYDNIDDDLDDKLLWAALFQDMNPT